MKQTALYPGFFDPPSLGHLDIITRSSKLVDRLIVGVAERKGKQSLLSVEDRVSLLRAMTKDLPNVEIISYSGLTADFAAKNHVSHLIRGLRLTTSVHDEFQIALANRSIANLETLFILGDAKFSHVSSTIIREINHFGGSLKGFVTGDVEDKMKMLSRLDLLNM